MEASFSDLEKARHIYNECVQSTLAHGTTTASYYATIHVEATKILAAICLEKGQRGLIGRVCMDHPNTLVDYYRDSDPQSAIASDKAVIEHNLVAASKLYENINVDAQRCILYLPFTLSFYFLVFTNSFLCKISLDSLFLRQPFQEIQELLTGWRNLF